MWVQILALSPPSWVTLASYLTSLSLGFLISPRPTLPHRVVRKHRQDDEQERHVEMQRLYKHMVC